MAQQRQPGVRQRQGSFTLVELMIVMAIIAILMALVASAVSRSITGQRVTNSQTEVKKLQQLLLSQMKIVQDSAMDSNREAIPTWVNNIATLNSTISDPNQQRAKVVYAKFRIRADFPMNFYEVFNPPGTLAYGNTNLYQQKLKNAGITSANVSASTPPGPEEGAICLAMALSVSRGGGTIGLTDIVSVLPKSTKYPTLDMLTDGFDQPLGFYRWPTDNVDLNPSGATVGFNDAQDPQGFLSVPVWVNAPAVSGQPQGGSLFASYCHKVAAGSSYSMQPVIVSGGRDMILGVTAVNAGTPNGMQKAYPAAGDDIYSYSP